jgi:hypothetical protein
VPVVLVKFKLFNVMLEAFVAEIDDPCVPFIVDVPALNVVAIPGSKKVPPTLIEIVLDPALKVLGEPLEKPVFGKLNCVGEKAKLFVEKVAAASKLKILTVNALLIDHELPIP